VLKRVHRSLRAARMSTALACVVVCLQPSVAGAQAALTRPENPEVEKLVARGIELRNDGKDSEALKTFQKAAEIDPDSVRVQLHLATVYQALGNWLMADDYLTLALRRENHPYVSRHRKALEEAQRVINANIGRLEVEGEPAGAEVRLNGHLVGTLPLAEPVRVTVGQYMLEVRLDGHYTARRPIVIAGRALVRESVSLEALASEDRTAEKPEGGVLRPAARGGTEDTSASRPWLTWTLVGLGGAAAVTTVAAVVSRELHAGRWNDNARCLEVDRTREEVCGSEREKAETAGTVAVVGAVATGLFAAGALANVFVFAPSAAPGDVGVSGCALAIGGVSCFGSF
jgi:tetratricopeptide (TPR) repeat protein